MVSALDRFTIESRRSPERLITVYVPDDAGAGAPRPLLLLHDGQNLFDADRAHVPGQHWRVAETADALIAAGRLPPIVIVGIDHLGPDRIREFTPTPGDKKLGGGLAEYGRFLVDELVPDLARRFPGLIDVTALAMGGSSLGGLATLGIARQFPGRFTRLLVMSPSVWWDRRAILRRLHRVGIPSRTRVWLDIGAHEGARAVTDARALRDELRSLKVDLQYVEDPEGHHTEAAWAARFGAAVEWIYAGAAGAAGATP